VVSDWWIVDMLAMDFDVRSPSESRSMTISLRLAESQDVPVLRGLIEALVLGLQGGN